MRSGVNFDVAFSLDDIDRTGWCIILSEMDGREFDFDTMTFKDAE